METLKYKVISTKKQYKEYCEILYNFLNDTNKTREIKEEIDLLTALIEKWDNEHNSFNELDPVQLLKALMLENNITANELSKILHVTKGMVSEILNYHKGLSKNNIQALASRFKIAQEAFNRNYLLKPRVYQIAGNPALNNKPYRSTRSRKSRTRLLSKPPTR